MNLHPGGEATIRRHVWSERKTFGKRFPGGRWFRDDSREDGDYHNRICPTSPTSRTTQLGLDGFGRKAGALKPKLRDGVKLGPLDTLGGD